MSTKLLVLFLATIAGLMVGLALSKRINQREKYFDELVRIVERLISDIKFSQLKVEEILSSYASISPHLSVNIGEYTAFIRGATDSAGTADAVTGDAMAGDAGTGGAGAELKISRGLLTKREHRLITDFFKRLGSLDLGTQIDELTNQKQVFDGYKLEAKAKFKGYGRALIKLGLLGGMLVGILLL